MARRYGMIGICSAVWLSSMFMHASAQIPRWTLSANPTLQIGCEDGRPECTLHRVVAVTRLGDGSLAVANAGTMEIMVYDSQGRHRHTFGGNGDGPGEFRSIWTMGRYRGDSLWVAQHIGLTVSVFDSQLRYARDFRLVAPTAHLDAIYYGDLPHALGTFSDGSVIIETPYALPIDAPPGNHWFTTEIRRLSAVGGDLSPLGKYPALPVHVESPGIRGRRSHPLFMPRLATAVVDSGVFIGTGPTHAIHFITPDGSVRNIYRPEPGPRVERRHVEAYQREGAARRPAGQPAPPPPEMVAQRFPPYSRLVPGGNGELWLQAYPVPGEATWQSQIVAPDRGVVATVTIPARFIVHLFDGNRVVGVWLNDNDVEFVREYRIERAMSRDD